MDAPRAQRALVLFVSLIAACGGSNAPSGTPTDGSVDSGNPDAGPPSLSEGYYAISRVTGLSDSCGLLPTSANIAASQATVLVTPTSVSVGAFPVVGGFGPGLPTGYLSGLQITAGGTAMLDFTMGALMNPPYDCVLQSNGDLTGTILGADTARVTLDVTLTVVSGTQCGLATNYLTGTTASPPCHSTVTFDLTKTGNIPPPPVYRLDSFLASGAVLTTPSNTMPTTGSATVTGVFEDTNIAGSYVSSCAAPDGTLLTQYAVSAYSADYFVVVYVDPAVWTTMQQLTIDGSSVRVEVMRRSDGARAAATSGTVTIDSNPTVLNDPGSLCGVTVGTLELTPL